MRLTLVAALLVVAVGALPQQGDSVVLGEAKDASTAPPAKDSTPPAPTADTKDSKEAPAARPGPPVETKEEAEAEDKAAAKEADAEGEKHKQSFINGYHAGVLAQKAEMKKVVADTAKSIEDAGKDGKAPKSAL